MKAARTRALNAKHAGTAKHASTTKHTGTAKRKAATAHKQAAARTAAQIKAAKARAWTPDGDVALCSARAVAEALRLTLGVAVDDADVLAWYWSTATDADEGQTIPDALSAAGGRLSDDGVRILGVDWPEPHAVVELDGVWWSWGEPYEPWTDDVSETWAVTWQ